MNVAVIISTWSRKPDRSPHLCNTLGRHDPRFEYDLVLCANGLDYIPPKAVANQCVQVFIRENTGYNLAAWDYAWRHLPNHDHFLFLQDDCFVFKRGWLRDFANSFASTPHCGLVGENINPFWDQPWLELCEPPVNRGPQRNREANQCAEWARFFRQKLQQWNIPEGQTARHLTGVVHFTSRTVLEEVDGYNLGNTKLEATAAEIGFSRKIAARGYALVQIGRWRHSRIGHPQWPSSAPTARLWRSMKKRTPPFLMRLR